MKKKFIVIFIFLLMLLIKPFIDINYSNEDSDNLFIGSYTFGYCNVHGNSGHKYRVGGPTGDFIDGNYHDLICDCGDTITESHSFGNSYMQWPYGTNTSRHCTVCKCGVWKAEDHSWSSRHSLHCL